MNGIDNNMWDIKKLNNKVIVIKYGGNSMVDSDSITDFLKQIVYLNKLGMKVILVHGGGPEISSLMEKLNMKPMFIDGLRVTDEETLNIVKMVLIGKINKELVSILSTLGGKAVGISGIDGNLLVSSKKLIKRTENGEIKTIDAGYIGEVKKVNTDILNMMLDNDIIPVIAPVGIGENGESYNVNGDDASSGIAAAMKAHVFALVSNIDGVYRDINNKSSKIPKLNISNAELLIKDGVINGGMIPKIKCSIEALKKGVKSVFIISSLIEDNLIKNVIGTKMTGTTIEF